ncbi:hypothetical protein SAMN06265338_11525 [Rhodoblastus acidophilus]|uniref:Uncharacterized protein n=1 Tax=Rhodoblastus acidophilus TaxID=1074 RepID=A0A212S882_RHOAC|nr:hypothetical protein [Rhodoblastus acidophilus]MCW2318300.1 hypothetical protein [Rhodoblastus acidophilus]PPQ37057.1 hypothetical protein CKO16_15820 [Rhodoblastus acidophilus]RAI20365.1 hypothetical protein CH337_10220 [Rhodoblastus acidophilus]SNB81362.1 hypothetical protein SAMN06265338_11525 [Rhodoblastus acidophilus]
MADAGGGLGQSETAIIGMATTVLAGFLGKFWDHLFGGHAAAEKQRAEARKLLEDAFDEKTRSLIDSYGKMIDDVKEFYEKRIDENNRFYEKRIEELHGEMTHWRDETISLRKALDALRARAAGQQDWDRN